MWEYVGGGLVSTILAITFNGNQRYLQYLLRGVTKGKSQNKVEKGSPADNGALEKKENDVDLPLVIFILIVYTRSSSTFEIQEFWCFDTRWRFASTEKGYHLQ